MMRIALLPLAAALVAAPARQIWPQQSAISNLNVEHSEAPDTTLARARQLVGAERFPEAETALRAFLSTTPNSAPAHYLLAYSLLRQNKPKESLAEYTRAAALQPPSADDLKNVGQAYVLLDDFVDASRWMARAAAMAPKDPDIWYALGRLRYSEQKYTEAAACFQKALVFAPQNVKAEDNLGLAYEGLNRPDDAIAAYRQAIAWQDADPSKKPSEQPLLNLAAALLHRGNIEDAQPLLRRAAVIAPEDPHVREQLGHLDLQQSNFAEAAAEFEIAIHHDPKRSDLHFLLGQAYRHLGRTRDAKEQFDLAARLANPPTFPDKK